MEKWSLKSVELFERMSSKVLCWSQEEGELRASLSPLDMKERNSRKTKKCGRSRFGYSDLLPEKQQNEQFLKEYVNLKCHIQLFHAACFVLK